MSTIRHRIQAPRPWSYRTRADPAPPPLAPSSDASWERRAPRPRHSRASISVGSGYFPPPPPSPTDDTYIPHRDRRASAFHPPPPPTFAGDDYAPFDGPAPARPGFWSCAYCTARVTATRARCLVCGIPRHGPASRAPSSDADETVVGMPSLGRGVGDEHGPEHAVDDRSFYGVVNEHADDYLGADFSDHYDEPEPRERGRRRRPWWLRRYQPPLASLAPFPADNDVDADGGYQYLHPPGAALPPARPIPRRLAVARAAAVAAAWPRAVDLPPLLVVTAEAAPARRRRWPAVRLSGVEYGGDARRAWRPDEGRGPRARGRGAPPLAVERRRDGRLCLVARR